MTDHIHDLGAGFWNIRGTFRLGGVLNIIREIYLFGQLRPNG